MAQLRVGHSISLSTRRGQRSLDKRLRKKKATENLALLFTKLRIKVERQQKCDKRQ